VLAFVAAAIWLGAELRKSRAARRARKRTAPTAIAPLAAPPFGPAVVAGADESVGAVAAQLGALVGAIDRLVARLDAGPAGGPTAFETGPAPGPATSAAESGALLYAPAARVPEPSPDDLYDWPTEAQLEQFEARRQAAQHDIP
jgi:hypothetical protein